MFELAVFLNMFFPSGSTIELASTKEEVDAAFVIYPQLGLEFTAYFGDFKPLGRATRSVVTAARSGVGAAERGLPRLVLLLPAASAAGVVCPEGMVAVAGAGRVGMRGQPLAS